MEESDPVSSDKKWRVKCPSDTYGVLEFIAQHGSAALKEMDEQQGKNLARLQADKMYRCGVFLSKKKVANSKNRYTVFSYNNSQDDHDGVGSHLQR